MYDKNYYAERKQELEKDFNKKVSTGLQKIFQVVNEIQTDLSDIQKKFQELSVKESEAQKNADKKLEKK